MYYFVKFDDFGEPDSILISECKTEEETENEYYVSKGDDEQQAICREESRILYVAMTRAAKNLICLITSNNDPDTWEYYIKNCQEVR